MSASHGTKRHISAHRLPVSLSVPRAKPSLARSAPGAAFLTQLMQSPPNPGLTGQPRESYASATYRRTEVSDVKRMPAGYRTSRTI